MQVTEELDSPGETSEYLLQRNKCIPQADNVNIAATKIIKNINPCGPRLRLPSAPGIINKHNIDNVYCWHSSQGKRCGSFCPFLIAFVFVLHVSFLRKWRAGGRLVGVIGLFHRA